MEDLWNYSMSLVKEQLTKKEEEEEEDLEKSQMEKIMGSRKLWAI